MSLLRIVLFIGVVILWTSCSKNKKPVIIEEVKLVGSAKLDVPEQLSQWKLFEAPINKLVPVEGVVPYDLQTPLFTDYALKSRFVKLPSNELANYSNDEVMEFPKGTILIKNFYYKNDLTKADSDRRIIETRLLIHEEKGWNALTYVWNEEQTEAQLEIAGRSLPVSWTNDEGIVKKVNYSVPNLVQCKSCHEKIAKMSPIGPTARQLNHSFGYSSGAQNQLIYWVENDMIDSLPDLDLIPRLAKWDDPTSGTLDERARAWLEINCAHCHRAEGPAKNTGLHLMASEKDLYRIGVNKPPIAAGRGSGGMKYGIVPGKPEESILLHRIESLDPGVMMPELGRKLQHEEGIHLIREWIANMQ